MTPEYLKYAEALVSDLTAARQPVSAGVVKRLLAERAALLAACEGVVDICDDTFIDPQEMSADWVLTFNTLKAAVAEAESEHTA